MRSSVTEESVVAVGATSDRDRTRTATDSDSSVPLDLVARDRAGNVFASHRCDSPEDAFELACLWVAAFDGVLEVRRVP